MAGLNCGMSYRRRRAAYSDSWYNFTPNHREIESLSRARFVPNHWRAQLLSQLLPHPATGLLSLPVWIVCPFAYDLSGVSGHAAMLKATAETRRWPARRNSVRARHCVLSPGP